MKPFLDSTDCVDDGAELVRRMERDGYLFVRNLLPAHPLTSLRLRFLELARDGGWVATEAPLEEAVADLNGFCVEPEPKYNLVYRQMYKVAEFHALQHHPNLLELLERMTGEPVIPHPRIIGRTIFPQREAFTTPPHQDYIPIQGTTDTYTAWFPLADLPAETGGLQIAAGSHRHGVYNFRPCLGAGGMEIVEDPGNWVGAPFAVGDVLFFHSMVVHRGVPNTGRSLRLSVDARYQKRSDPVSDQSLLPHIMPVPWEEVYADWPSDEYQYYWRDWEAEFVDYDYSYNEKRDRMAFELAEQGDKVAISALQRIIARDQDVAKIARAECLLAQLEEPA